MGPIFGAVGERLETVVILAGGGIFDNMPPQLELVSLAPRVRVPVLTVNGQDDFVFPAEATRRMLGLPGMPEKEKK